MKHPAGPDCGPCATPGFSLPGAMSTGAPPVAPGSLSSPAGPSSCRFRSHSAISIRACPPYIGATCGPTAALPTARVFASRGNCRPRRTAVLLSATACFLLPSAYCHFLLPSAHCLLPFAFCLLPTSSGARGRKGVARSISNGNPRASLPTEAIQAPVHPAISVRHQSLSRQDLSFVSYFQ